MCVCVVLPTALFIAEKEHSHVRVALDEAFNLTSTPAVVVSPAGQQYWSDGAEVALR